MTRPVAQKVWSGSTSTGVSDWAYFAPGQQYVTAYITNASTKEITTAVEVTAGMSTAAVAVLAAAATTGANAQRSSTGGIVFDKARVNVSANATTGVVNIVLAAAP